MSGFIEDPNFTPKSKTFYFNFNKDTYFKQKYGICSLTLKKIPFAYKIANLFLDRDPRINYRRRHLTYCNFLATIMHSTYRGGSSILIYKHVCGHYSFCDGQHRVCIAAKKNINIPVNIKKLDVECPYCNDKNRNNGNTLLKLTKF